MAPTSATPGTKMPIAPVTSFPLSMARAARITLTPTAMATPRREPSCASFRSRGEVLSTVRPPSISAISTASTEVRPSCDQ